uniref:Uncharacterized protein n=1 Tax=uncultured bacterium contig00060 TaxID=1181543 RepID=A0A806KJ72_9BACT|nr:hypothetical protein [uncultured bacterium contig00060]
MPVFYMNLIDLKMNFCLFRYYYEKTEKAYWRIGLTVK